MNRFPWDKLYCVSTDSIPNRSDHIRFAMDLRYQSPNRPWGFFGKSSGILLRSPSKPDHKPDWDFYATQGRYYIIKEMVAEKTVCVKMFKILCKCKCKNIFFVGIIIDNKENSFLQTFELRLGKIYKSLFLLRLLLLFGIIIIVKEQSWEITDVCHQSIVTS